MSSIVAPIPNRPLASSPPPSPTYDPQLVQFIDAVVNISATRIGYIAGGHRPPLTRTSSFNTPIPAMARRGPSQPLLRHLVGHGSVHHRAAFAWGVVTHQTGAVRALSVRFSDEVDCNGDVSVCEVELPIPVTVEDEQDSCPEDLMEESSEEDAASSTCENSTDDEEEDAWDLFVRGITSEISPAEKPKESPLVLLDTTSIRPESPRFGLRGPSP